VQVKGKVVAITERQMIVVKEKNLLHIKDPRLYPLFLLVSRAKTKESECVEAMA
jgi:hypothetical protein